jgi:hypothetical protein
LRREIFPQGLPPEQWKREGCTSLGWPDWPQLSRNPARLSAQEAHDLARLEERYQESRWGIDAEAAARTEARRTEALMLQAWFSALG